MLVGTKHILFAPLALLRGGRTTVLMRLKCALVSLRPCQDCSRGGTASHRAWVQWDSCGHQNVEILYTQRKLLRSEGGKSQVKDAVSCLHAGQESRCQTEPTNRNLLRYISSNPFYP